MLLKPEVIVGSIDLSKTLGKRPLDTFLFAFSHFNPLNTYHIHRRRQRRVVSLRRKLETQSYVNFTPLTLSDPTSENKSVGKILCGNEEVFNSYSFEKRNKSRAEVVGQKAGIAKRYG